MQCLEKGDALELVKIERSLTIEKCVSAPLLINQKSNESELIKSVFMIVKRFNDLVNVSKKMNEDQMIALSSDLFERFGGESLDDILLFFKMARNGEFGDLYRLDSIVILSWVPKYLNKKIEAFHEDRINRENIRLRSENDAVSNHEYSEKSKEKLEELSKMLKTTTVKRNTGIIRNDNPLFNYEEYLKTLPEVATQMTDQHLQTMIDNTSKYSHPDVYEILALEQESRKHEPKPKQRKSKNDQSNTRTG